MPLHIQHTLTYITLKFNLFKLLSLKCVELMSFVVIISQKSGACAQAVGVYVTAMMSVTSLKEQKLANASTEKSHSYFCL